MNSTNKILEEYNKSCGKFPPFNTPHEGYAVLLEELDELWDVIKKTKYPVTYLDCEAMEKEVIQVGAMAIKFLESFDNFMNWKTVNND